MSDELQTGRMTAHDRLIFCMPWHARGFEGEPVRGGVCARCGRDVAVPISAHGKIVGCIYCGLETGYVAEQEIEPGGKIEAVDPETESP